jgi:hypothetical protein
VSILYPSDVDQNHTEACHETREQLARQGLDPSDILAELQHVLLEIDDDAQHPFWPLVRHCTRIGTTQETGQMPYLAELVGAALIPLIDRAIARLVRQALDHDATWEVA